MSDANDEIFDKVGDDRRSFMKKMVCLLYTSPSPRDS